MFLTDDAAYAAGYVRNNGQVVKVEIPMQLYEDWTIKGWLQQMPGINSSTGQYGTEFIVSDLNLKQTIVNMFKPYTP